MRTKQLTQTRFKPGKSARLVAILLNCMLVTLILGACGDATATVASSTTAAVSATTAAATKASVTTAAATSTTAAASATTASATTAAASATTAASVTTAAVTTSTAVPGGQMVELTYDLNDSAAETPGWTAQVDAANKILASKGIHIKIQKIASPNGWTDYYTKIASEIAAGKSPDIARVAESLLPQLIAKDQVVDLTDTVKQLDPAQFIAKPFQNAGYKDGKYYGIPSGSYHMVMYYNKDMLDKAGIKLSQDWNNGNSFDQIAQYAKQLTTGTGGNKVFGLSAGQYLAFAGMYAVSNGSKNVFNSDGTCA